MEQQIKYNGRNINFQVSGNGQCIVFLHGFLESLKIWDDFTTALSSDFKVIAIDLPGHGQTENFSDIHTMSFMADIVKVVLDNQKINECMMIGHSMGGYVTLAFAERYSAMLKGFCLFHSQAAADTEDVKANRERTINIVNKNRLNFIQMFIPDLFASANRKIFKEEIEVLKKQAGNTTKAGIIAALNGMKERTDQTELLKSFKKPILYIIGKEDSRIPVETALSQCRSPNRSTVQLLGGVGHMGYIEAKDETIGYIRQFCDNAFNISLNS